MKGLTLKVAAAILSLSSSVPSMAENNPEVTAGASVQGKAETYQSGAGCMACHQNEAEQSDDADHETD